MSLIQRAQKETLVWWKLKSANRNGEPNYWPPVELSCRWDDKTTEILASDNTTVLSRVEIISQVRLNPGDYVCRGTINTITYWAEPKKNLDSYEVLRGSETPTLRYNDRLYEAWA